MARTCFKSGISKVRCSSNVLRRKRLSLWARWATSLFIKSWWAKKMTWTELTACTKSSSCSQTRSRLSVRSKLSKISHLILIKTSQSLLSTTPLSSPTRQSLNTKTSQISCRLMRTQRSVNLIWSWAWSTLSLSGFAWINQTQTGEF